MKTFTTVISQALGGGKIPPAKCAWNITENTIQFVSPALTKPSVFNSDTIKISGIGLGVFNESPIQTKVDTGMFSGTVPSYAKTTSTGTSGGNTDPYWC
jgi:hypothetical protein